MMTIKFLTGLALATCLGGVARAADVGVCTWQRLPADERSQVVSAYQQSSPTVAGLWKSLEPEVASLAATCARPGLSPVLVQNATRAEAMQVSMADALQSARGLDRRELDAVWADAAPDIKNCVRAEAAKVYHQTPPYCLAPASRLYLVQQLGIPFTTAQRGAVKAALVYFTAKAHSEYVNAMLARAGHGG